MAKQDYMVNEGVQVWYVAVMYLPLATIQILAEVDDWQSGQDSQPSTE